MASPGPVLLLHYRSSVTPQKVKLDRCVLIAVVQIYTAALTGSNLFSEALVGRIGWQNAPSIPKNGGRRGLYETANYRKGHAFLESEYFLNGGFPVN
jgi:hypothetical protein